MCHSIPEIVAGVSSAWLAIDHIMGKTKFRSIIGLLYFAMATIVLAIILKKGEK